MKSVLGEDESAASGVDGICLVRLRKQMSRWIVANFERRASAIRA